MLRLGNLSGARAISFCLAITASLGTAQLYGQKPAVVVPAQAPVGMETPASRGLPLQIYNMPPEMVGSVGATLRIKYASRQDVTITIEPGTDRLMVMAPEAVHREIAQTIRGINSETGLKVNPIGGPAPAPVETQRIYQLRHAHADQFESSLVAAGARKLSEYETTQGVIVDYRLDIAGDAASELRVDRRNNSVIIQGSSKDVAAWQLAVAAIDNSFERGAAPTKLVQLERAKPENVQRAIKLMKLVAFQNNAAVDESGIVQTDENGNPLDGQEPAVGIIDPQTEESGLFGDVDIAFVPDLGLAIVKGSKRDVQRVLEVIEQIKKQSDATQPVINVVPLKHVDSLALATVLNDLYTQNFAQRQGTVSITGLGQPNAILLIGREEAMTAILDLVKKLDQPLDPSSQLKVFKLIHTSALQMQTTVRDFFVERAPTAATPRPGLGVRVSVVADYRTNALIVQASPRDLLEVAKLIDELDVASTQTEIEMRVFPLRNALSDDLAPILQDAINGPADTAGEGQVQAPNGKLSIVDRSIPGDERRLNGGILAGVLVTSNPSINALLVRAPARSLELIEVLIKQLDQPPSLESQIKVFPIEHNDATALAQLIQQLFGIPVTAGVATGGLGAAFNQNTAQGTGNDILVPLRVSVDTRSNSIIVSGSRGNLEVVEVLIWRLDEQGVQTRKTEVVWLRNSNATDVADAITQFLTTQRQTIQQQLLQGNAISIYEQIDREVIVVAEPTTNSLIISATPRFYTQIMAVIERLDRRPPLIMVQMLMAEVELDDTFELGAELGLQDSLIFDRNTATGGTLTSPAFNLTNPLNAATTKGLPQNVAGQGFSGFGLGRSNSTLGYGGLVLSAASESVNILVRALQDANRLQILSRPQVMTLDTIEAYVLVGQRVPRVTAVSGGSTIAGQTIATTDTEVGLIMRIQPRTNQDGLIILDVQIERSSLGNVDTGIPVGFSANGDVIRSPIINTTRAQTRISAYDGQTVVFAGLIQKTRNSHSRRIPWLADIPIAGHLFRFDSESEIRSELLVILTPRIIHGETDIEMVNQLETARMSWCLADVVNINGVTNLSSGNGLWGPACSAVIYPDLNPTIEFLDGVEVNGADLNQTIVPVEPAEVVPVVPTAPATPKDPVQGVADPLVPQASYQQGQPMLQMPNTVQPANYQNPSNVYIQR